MINVIWDMETGDPDDFLTLLLLIGHSDVNLQVVNVTIGTPDQIGIVRFALNKFGLNIPVGSYNINHPKKCVSEWHYKTFGNISESRDAEYGPELLYNMCDDDTILITGAPLKSLGQVLIEYPSIKIGSQHLNMIWKAMDRYLFKKKEKKFHDPLAACAAIDKSIIEWREVSIFRDEVGWDLRLYNGSNIWISIDYDRDKFIKTLVKHLRRKKDEESIFVFEFIRSINVNWSSR